jgi:gas vesicle protein
MTDRDTSEVWTAVAVGAIIGIGAALLVRARQEDDTHELIKRLRPVTRQAKQAAQSARRELGRRARQAGDSGENLLSSSREILDEMQKGAREIILSTRDELRQAARDSIRDARKAARRAQRGLSR